MNRLKTTDTGGFPLRLDDFRWLHDADKEMVLAWVRTLIGMDIDACILAGCEIVITEQGDIWTCSEGFVFFNSEVYYVPAHEVLENGFVYFIEDISYETPSGLKTFEDANDHETYEYRRAKLESNDTLPATPYMGYAEPDIITILKNRLGISETVETGWTKVNLNSSNVTSLDGVITAISGTLKYKKRGLTALVSFDCSFQVTSTSSRIDIILPSALTVNLDNGNDSNLIHNLAASTAGERSDFIYRVLAEFATDRISIKNIDKSTQIVANTYQMKGQIYFEIK